MLNIFYEKEVVLVNLSMVQIESLATSIVGKGMKMTPIGNHHLCRHLVFKIQTRENTQYVLKIYYKSGSRDCERAALDVLSNRDIKTTTIVKYGNYEDYEWVLYDFIEGQLLDIVMDDIPSNQLDVIFTELGRIYGTMHQERYEAMGKWNANGEILDPITDTKEWAKSYIAEIIETMREQAFHNNPVIEELCKSFTEDDIDNFANLDVCLVHFDLDGRNIIIKHNDGDFTLNGIIDFESSKPWFRDRSFVPLFFRYFYYNKEMEINFWKGYEEVAPKPLGLEGRIESYLKMFILSNLSWCKKDAPDYYVQNIQFASNFLVSHSRNGIA